jgi:hypothetical protein
MSIKVSVCISLEHVFGSNTDTLSSPCSHKFGLYLYFGFNGPTVHTTETGGDGTAWTPECIASVTVASS